MDGIINLLKPPGLTSNRAINRFKRITGIKKVGHTGTLDPGAAGVLPLCVGKATKVASFLLQEEKEYWGEILLGRVTTTDDIYGEILAEKPVSIDNEQVSRALALFQGEIDQMPPQVSALKQNGRPAYKKVRRGENVEVPPRKVHIFNLSIQSVNLPIIRIYVHCSKGTYIRSLARDLGKELGTGGCLKFLIRTRNGPFCLADTCTFEEIERAGVERFILPTDTALLHLPLLELGEEFIAKVKQGQELKYQGSTTNEKAKQKIYRAYDQDGNLIALCRLKDDKIHPFKVFI